MTTEKKLIITESDEYGITVDVYYWDDALWDHNLTASTVATANARAGVDQPLCQEIKNEH